MDALEMLVRETLAERAGEAPGPDRLVAPPRSAERGPRRWPYALLAAAVVAAMAIGVVVLRGGSSGSEPAAPKPMFAPIPPGMNEVSYHGITLQVPDNLPIGPAAVCQPEGVHTFDPHAPQAQCQPISPPPADGGTVVDLTVYQDHSQELGGPLVTGAGNRERRPSQELDLRRPGVSVYVQAPTRREVRAIIGSVRVTPIDRNWCAATKQPLRNPPAASLLPDKPTSAAECVYTYVAKGPDFLLQSMPVDASRVAGLVAAVQRLPHGAGLPDVGFPHTTRYVFRYADGSQRVIEVRYGRPSTVTDGQHVAHDPDNTIARAFD